MGITELISLIGLESCPIELKSSIIERESPPIELESSLIELERALQLN